MSGGGIEPAASGHAHGRADGGHGHDAAPGHRHGEHGHSHGGIDPALLRSREAMRTLWLSLTILGATAIFQIVIVILSGSVALLADTVHNVGDALTAVPLAVAFCCCAGRAPHGCPTAGGAPRTSPDWPWLPSSCSRPSTPPTRRSSG